MEPLKSLELPKNNLWIYPDNDVDHDTAVSKITLNDTDSDFPLSVHIICIVKRSLHGNQDIQVKVL